MNVLEWEEARRAKRLAAEEAAAQPQAAVADEAEEVVAPVEVPEEAPVAPAEPLGVATPEEPQNTAESVSEPQDSTFVGGDETIQG